MTSHLMTDLGAIRTFLLAGRATVTLKSLKTGEHLTYKVNQAKDDNDHPTDLYFVSLLVSGDQYIYLGVLSAHSGQPWFKLTKKSRMVEASRPVQAFEYFCAVLRSGKAAPQLEIRHENHCGRCGRELTHPESIDLGIGPDCAEQMGLTSYASKQESML